MMHWMWQGSNVHVPHVVRRRQGDDVHNNNNVSECWGSWGGVWLRTLTKNVSFLWRSYGASPPRCGIRIRRHAPKEGEYNPKDSKGHTEVVTMMEKELKQEGQTNQMKHLSDNHCVDHINQSNHDCCDCSQTHNDGSSNGWNNVEMSLRVEVCMAMWEAMVCIFAIPDSLKVNIEQAWRKEGKGWLWWIRVTTPRKSSDKQETSCKTKGWLLTKAPTFHNWSKSHLRRWRYAKTFEKSFMQVEDKSCSRA